MRNVTRPHEPEVLITHGEHWKADLLNELEKGDQADKKRIKTIQNKYSHKDIKAALKKMYKYCCYCESRVNHVTVEHIEHRKPKAKDKFPEYTFEWGNLHLSCPNCNKEKGDKWNTNHPILDAEHDIPISRFLSYRRCERTYVNQRGKTTRDHANLNRDELVEARAVIYDDAMNLIETYNNDPDTQEAQIVPRKLEEFSKGEFGSFVEYLKKTYLKD